MTVGRVKRSRDAGGIDAGRVNAVWRIRDVMPRAKNFDFLHNFDRTRRRFATIYNDEATACVLKSALNDLKPFVFTAMGVGFQK